MTDYAYFPYVAYGKERRKLIKDWFNEHPDGMYAVNCKYRPQIHSDPDLKKLLKSGFLKKKRLVVGMGRHTMGWKKQPTGRTYLVKA